MASLHNDVFDSGLSVLTNATTPRLDLTTQEATTRTEAITTYTKGNKTSITIGSPGDRTGGGRKVTVSAITGGTVSGDGTVTHWAITDGTRLLATGSLSASQVVDDGAGSNTFSLAAFDIGIPDPA
jgi:hypothetical protein